ncbi:alpha-1A adrenergic receptor [Lates japonicus]|uniref:Alpha-1A adrenergic receptor n=1 Tax=Lates japonicus TaxID=270547 RepID=A0AAD3MGQ5_LATJO|nr:alpha-1A adrenergic receptor [Lates japonicus]
MVPVLDNMTPAPLTQNCSNCSQVLVPELNVVKAVVLGLVLGVFIVFGVVGNILVILSVVCHRHLRTVTHYFIVNLAVADLLLSSTVLPFSAILEILDRWVFGRAFCNVWAAVDVLCCTASIMSLCVISVDRYIGVSYPLRYPAIMTKRRALLAVMLLWVLSIIISIGPLFGWKEPAPEDESICKITEEPGYAIFSAGSLRMDSSWAGTKPLSELTTGGVGEQTSAAKRGQRRKRRRRDAGGPFCHRLMLLAGHRSVISAIFLFACFGSDLSRLWAVRFGCWSSWRARSRLSARSDGQDEKADERAGRVSRMV